MTNESAEAAVLAAFEGLYQSLLEDRDAAAGAARFCDAPDVAMWGSEEGERADGPVALRRLFDEIVAFRGTLRFEWRDRLVHVEGDVAWVNAAGRLVVEPEGETARTGPYRVTAVLVRRNGEWRWHTHNGSEPRVG